MLNCCSIMQQIVFAENKESSVVYIYIYNLNISDEEPFYGMLKVIIIIIIIIINIIINYYVIIK